MNCLGLDLASLIIAYFLGIDSMSLVMASMHGLLTFQTLLLTVACLVPLILGIVVGSNIFLKIDKESFRHHILILLIILSFSGLVRGLLV